MWTRTAVRGAFRAGRGSARLLGAGLLITMVFVAGCDLDQMVTVPDPDVATEESVRDPGALGVVYAGAVRDFQVAYSGHPSASLDEGVVLLSGLLADEYDAGGTFPTRIDIDSRGVDFQNGTVQDVFRRLHRARVSAMRAADAFEDIEPDDPRLAEVRNLAGLTYVYFGEMFCSGVPFSSPLVPGWEFGDPTPTPQIYQRAVAEFEAALAAPGVSAAQEHLARIGLARALLNLNEVADAAAAVATVPTEFAYELQHSDNSTTQNNGIWAALNSVKRYRIADAHGGNGLPYRSSGDPRIGWFEDGTAFDSELVSFAQEKYPERESSVFPVEGIEARLIEAEAALRAGPGGVSDFVDIHNELRAMVAGLDPFVEGDVAAMSQDERVDLHFEERAYWLWQTGHRLGDLRRLVRQYDRPQDEVFPTGPYFKGGTFGSDVNFPIPVDEGNNPNAAGCLDRNA